MNPKIIYIYSTIILVSTWLHAAKLEPIQNIRTESSPVLKDYTADKAVDGVVSDESRWIGIPDAEGKIWLQLSWDEEQELQGFHLMSGYGKASPIEGFTVEFKNREGEWVDIPSARIEGNKETALTLHFDTTVDVVTKSLRLNIDEATQDKARLKEIILWPDNGTKMPEVKQASPTSDSGIPLIYLNQTGFNAGKPKRFTAPTLKDETPFQVREVATGGVVYEGKIQNHIGDFSHFEPGTDGEFFVQAGSFHSVPFAIEPWLHERVSYQGSIDFFIDSRHYHGTSPKPARSSYAWRDDHAFAWILRGLVPQYLANPAAYRDMPRQMQYTQPQDGLWGALEPYDPSAPDIVKLIHWGADVIVTKKLKHEFFKGDLAYFLYAWPALEPWLPQQNYDAVLAFVKETWAQEDARKTPYDKSKNHNMFALKTYIGSNKGEHPPAHTLLPNTLMYEVAKRDGLLDSEKYFEAAYQQVAWVIQNIDWEDPRTTKGQRQSEHITITGLTVFYQLYPNKAPAGIQAKLEQWTEVVLRRSDNLWDFRKLTDDGNWTPSGDRRTMWNEPGNVMGFPACALSVLPFIQDSAKRDRLEQLVWSHIDNQWGRNPTGRHFSYDAPREIEGVERGWYTFHRGGIGQLAKARFVFDGAPKHVHYPYHPEVGKYGHNEGWVCFNSAFNLSLGYLARQDTELQIEQEGNKFKVQLNAPIHFDASADPTVEVRVAGKKEARLNLQRTSLREQAYTGELSLDQILAKPGDTIEVSYGYGYMQARKPKPIVE